MIPVIMSVFCGFNKVYTNKIIIVLDIYLTTNPSLVKNVAVVPGMSDHEGMAVIDIRSTYSRP